MWRHRALFWRPKLAPLLGGPSWPISHFKYCFKLKSVLKTDNWQTWTPQQGAQLGPPKKCSVAPHGRQDPPQNEAQLGIENRDF